MKKLCAKREVGTLDIWINPEEDFKLGGESQLIVTTLNGERPDKGYCSSYPKRSFEENPIETLDDMMSCLGRDTQNWGNRDLILHWGVHTFRFYNAKAIDEIDIHDGFNNTLEDIIYFNDIESEEEE